MIFKMCLANLNSHKLCVDRTSDKFRTSDKYISYMKMFYGAVSERRILFHGFFFGYSEFLKKPP